MRTRRQFGPFGFTGALLLGLAAVQGPAQAQQRPPFATPPADAMHRLEARQGMVTSANGLASDAGLAMLKAGGNAVDAAVATAFAIGVVEPQMSGLGGGGAAVIWMAREGSPGYLDFYAAQPVASWKGRTQPEPAARSGQEPGAAPPRAEPGDLRVAALPGEVAGLLALHERYGRLSREQVMAPAIRLAEEGYPVGQVLAGFIAQGLEKMKPFGEALALFAPGGKPLGPGETVKNAALAETLRRVQREGARGFYEGQTADALIATLSGGRHPATAADLAAFEPQWKRPLCGDYRGLTILSAAPPENGLQVLHTLELLEPHALRTLGFPQQSARSFDVMASALRVGHAAARGNGDPNWVPVPARGIASEAFAELRRPLVGTGAAAPAIEPAPADPFDRAQPPRACRAYAPYGPAEAPGAPPHAQAPDAAGERLDEPGGETTHISVVDKDGNAVALTQTNSSVWGSGGFSRGFFINDSGFRFTDANIALPSKSAWRVRTTTIAPTIVLRNGRVEMVVGAPGGARIPTEIVQVMVYVLDYGLDPLDAVKMPRMFASAQGTRVQLEQGFAPELLRDIRAMGYDPVPPSPEYARLYLIARRGAAWVGVADTRHDGRPRGY